MQSCMQNCDKIRLTKWDFLVSSSPVTTTFSLIGHPQLMSLAVSVHYSVGWWDSKQLVTDKIKLGAMAAVTAGFTMITTAEQC